MTITRQARTLSCVIPGLNEAENLPALMPVLVAQLRSLVQDFEIIFVDDGSTDATPLVVEHLRQTYPQLVYIQLSRNFGKEAALTAGLQASRGQIVVCMDADLQHPPALIADMMQRWACGVDMVYAVRETRDDETWMKRAGTSIFYKLMRTSSGLRVPRNAGDFRLLDRCVVDALLVLPERSRFMKGLFAWVGFPSEPIYYSPADRLHGTSRFRPGKLLGFAVDGLTAFTTWPLRLLCLMGAVLAMLSFGYGLFIIFKHLLYGDAVRGWATLITVVLFFAGVNMLSLGIVGEYVARIFAEVKNRPLYLVRRRQGQGLSAPPTDEAS
ncbi:glycosyltransferase family 2 protein [Alcaligenes sp. SDU_A2]|uniref:glycosyltransferase family 2 protein n=1 Tax=Alcaligenes sp. SDU_A2 TaxID=3136634 RepID=UPI002BAF9E29|nr:glycosyltransferase family 2 protein [Alcaligenes sp.]HRL27518.1 glycosyltransferase family 2 protein [Alcaligenes sp.]